MVPLFIIEEKRKRDREQEKRQVQIVLELPLPNLPPPRYVPDDEDRGSITIEVL